MFDSEIVSQKQTFSTEHILPTKLTIPSDGKKHDIVINENRIKAKYRHITVPKLEPKAYLTAEIMDWGKYNLSSGEMKLYFEGTYVGKSYVNVSELTDTLTMSLGPDIVINVKKNLLRDFCKTSFFSSKRAEKYVYDLIIKNNKPGTIEIRLQDQFPILTDASMELEIEELSGGKHNKETGLIEWILTMKPGEQAKKRIEYTLKIPKDRHVNH